jgi:UDP-N-acetylmuramyl tripeptide synthase
MTSQFRGDVQRNGATLDLRLTSAVAIGKLAGLASRHLGLGGGTALPGALAGRFDSGSLAKLTRDLPRGTILVTGTNGKTTTSRLLAAMLQTAGWRLIHNRAGANLTSGLTTALIERCDLAGRSVADSALFEVDEAVLPRVQATTRPRVIVLTNLFRDQLDRYGEVDHVAGIWRKALADVTPDATVVLNADDPSLAALGRRLRSRVLYYGIDAPSAGSRLDHFADVRDCPLCGQPLDYQVVRYAHVGTYHCPAGDFERPPVDVVARTCVPRGVEGTDVEVVGPFGTRDWCFKLPGLYNVYNLLAAVAAAAALEVPAAAIDAAIANFTAAFGRLERIQVGDKTLFIALIKNPVGFTEVLRTIFAEPGERDLAILINDNLADGTDVSWLWDAEVEVLSGRCRTVVVGGTRGADMAVRLKYAGLAGERIQVADQVEAAIDVGLAQVAAGGTLFVLPTYTAMLALRTLAGRRGYAGYFWES